MNIGLIFNNKKVEVTFCKESLINGGKNLNINATYSVNEIEQLIYDYTIKVPTKFPPNSLKDVNDLLYSMSTVIIADLKVFQWKFKNWLSNTVQYVLTYAEEVNAYGKKGVKATFICIGLAYTTIGGISVYKEKTKDIVSGIGEEFVSLSNGNTISFSDYQRANKIKCLATLETTKEKERLVKRVEKHKKKVVKKQKGIDRQLSISDEKLNKLSTKEKSKLILNKWEGMYPIPYFDFSQFSVGYGSYISYENCKVIWKRMGISEEEGKFVAHEIHRLQKAKKWKEARLLLKKYSSYKGVVSKEEAEFLRDKEYKKFETYIDENFTYLPEHQRKILTITVYNTGIAGFTGGTFTTSKGKKKYYPPSPLYTALKNNDWFSDEVYNAYTKTKLFAGGKYMKGLYNRRVSERDAFFATVKESSKEQFTHDLKESLANN